MPSLRHTPGPWSATGKGIDGGRMVVNATGPGRSGTIAIVTNRTQGKGRVGHNARLIATAPDLVAALATMLGVAEMDALDDKSNVWRSAMIDARAAIAKAEGRD
jgi:hypothetical protein